MNSVMNNSFLEVNLITLQENARAISAGLSGGCRLMPVLKDDAYGLGLVPVAKALEELKEIDCLVVSHVSEGLELREAGIAKDILVMNSALPFQMGATLENNLILSCARDGFVSELAAEARRINKRARIHIKIDSGLHRIGFESEKELDSLVSELNSASELISLEGAFSHFSNTDDAERCEQEYASFISMTGYLEKRGINVGARHMSCSAASELYPQYNMDGIRIGRRLYMDNPTNPTGEIKELASWRAYVCSVKERKAGERLGYGEGLSLEKDCTVATVGVGYGDGLGFGYAEKRAPALWQGKKLHVLRSFMDQSLVDVSGTDCKVGDEICFFGYDGFGGFISAQQQALLLNAAEGCELSSNLSGRVSRVYIK